MLCFCIRWRKERKNLKKGIKSAVDKNNIGAHKKRKKNGRAITIWRVVQKRSHEQMKNYQYMQ